MLEPLFRAAFWVLLGGLLVTRTHFSRGSRAAGVRGRPDREAVEREGRGLFAARALVLVLGMVLLVLYAYDSPWLTALSVPLPPFLRWIGLALGLLSLGLWAWTHATLGREWSPQLQLQAQHRLVTTGPYHWVRHPMYTSISGVVIALALLAANWAFVLLAAAVIAGLVARAPREEVMMLEAFGEEYATYRQRTGRFFPRPRRP